MSKKLVAFISSRNNYDMLENEVLVNNKFDGIKLVNVDDNSEKHELEKGIEICKKNNILFLKNKNKGIQWAFQTMTQNLSEDVEWAICLQHDCYPISSFFYKRLSRLIQEKNLKNYSVLGFHFLQTHPRNSQLNKQVIDFYKGKETTSILGIMHFSMKHYFFKKLFLPRRILCTYPNIPNDNILRNFIYQFSKHSILKNNKFKKPFIIEMPYWPIVCINIKLWKKFIKPTNKLRLHLWFPDIMMTFNQNNYPCLILPDLYCLNNQDLKLKYNIMRNSADANKDKKQQEKYFGEYGSHFEYFTNKWGWDYENVRWTLKGKVLEKYKGTLIEKFNNHNIYKGPLENIDLGNY